MRSGTGRRAAWLSVGSFLFVGALGCWSTSSGVAVRPTSPSPMWRPSTSGQAKVRPSTGPTTPSVNNGAVVATQGTNPGPVSASPLPTRPDRPAVGANERATLSQGAIAAVEKGTNSGGEILPPPDSAIHRESAPIATSSNSSAGRSNPAVQPVSHATASGKLPDVDPVPESQPSTQPTDLPAVAPISYQDIPIKRNWQKTSPPVMPVETDLPAPSPTPKLRGAEPVAPLSPPPK